MGPGWGDGTLRSTQTCTKPSIPRSGGEVAYLAFFQRAFGWPAQAFSREALPGLPHPLAGFWRRVGSCHRGHHAHALPLTRRPLALDFHPAFATRCPLAKTAPCPTLRARAQPPPQRVAVNIAQFLHSFLLAPYRKIVVPHLPKARQIAWAQLARSDLLKHLHYHRKFASLRLTDQQMHMFRHHHVAAHVAPVPAPHPFQFVLEYLSCRRVQQLSPLITTEGNEMQATLVLVTLGFCPHTRDCTPTLSLQNRERQGWGNPSFKSGKAGPAPLLVAQRLDGIEVRGANGGEHAAGNAH